MSRLSLIAFDQQGNVKQVREFRNAHRFYDIIHADLWGTYFDRKNPYSYIINPQNFQRLADLVDDPRTSWDEKIVLACTFDYAIIRRNEFGKLIECFKEYSIYHQSGHMWAIADELVKLQKDESIYGIGFEESVMDAWHEWSRQGIGEEYGDGEYEDYLHQWDFADPRTYYPFDEIECEVTGE